MNPVTTSPYKRLYQELQGRIAGKTLTGKLPSISMLSREYSVSHNTVAKVLSMLKEQRFIYGEQGKGHFVNPDGDVNLLAQKVVTLYIHSNLFQYPFYMQLIFEIRRLLEAERCNVSLINSLSQLKAFAGRIDVLLLFEQFEDDELACVLELIPEERIICCNCHAPVACREVGTDNFGGGFMAMQELYDAGSRNIGVIRVVDYEDKRSHFFQRRRGVEAFAAQHPDISVTAVACPVAELVPPIGTVWMKRLEAQAPAPLDGVFVFMDLLALGVYRRMAETGRRFAVIGHDDRDFAAELVPALTSIRENAPAIAAELRNQIREVLAGLEPEAAVPGPVVRVPPQKIVRESTESFYGKA